MSISKTTYFSPDIPPLGNFILSESVIEEDRLIEKETPSPQPFSPSDFFISSPQLNTQDAPTTPSPFFNELDSEEDFSCSSTDFSCEENSCEESSSEEAESKIKNEIKKSLKGSTLPVLNSFISQGSSSSLIFEQIHAVAAQEVLDERNQDLELKMKERKPIMKHFLRNYNNSSLQEMVKLGLSSPEEFKQVYGMIAQEILDERAQMPYPDPETVRDWTQIFSEQHGRFAIQYAIKRGLHSSSEFERVHTEAVLDIVNRLGKDILEPNQSEQIVDLRKRERTLGEIDSFIKETPAKRKRTVESLLDKV